MDGNGGTWRELLATGRLTQFIILCLGVWLHAADSFLAATALPEVSNNPAIVADDCWNDSRRAGSEP